jgi:GDP-4-dehydro-6-deoxy-D-mannose reductase
VTTRREGVALVTGASGFAGSHLVERLLASHHSVAAWSNPDRRDDRATDPRVQWSAVDLLEREVVEHSLSDLRPAVIFHCAGVAHVAESWSDSARPLRVNAFGTSLLLDAVTRIVPGCRVVITCSALVYKPSTRALSEDDAIGPSDPYGVSKLAQELAGMRSIGDVIVTRSFNHVGPRQPSSFVLASFAKQIAETEAGRRDPVLYVGNLEARRDITDVRDTVRAYEMLAASGRHHYPYNVCSGVAHRVGDLLEKLLGMARLHVRIQHDLARMRPSDNPVVLGDPSRIRSDTGWRPEIPIEKTLSDLLDYWRAEIAAAPSAGSA